MLLYVLRHAIAEEPLLGRADSSRRVTGKGRRKAERVLSHARRIGVRPAVVLTSPYRRAVETAAIAQGELRLDASPLVTEALSPDGSLLALWDVIRDHRFEGDLMVVGHNPQLSLLAMCLLGGREDALWLKKAGLMALDVGGAAPLLRATLSWLLTPKSVGRRRA